MCSDRLCDSMVCLRQNGLFATVWFVENVSGKTRTKGSSYVSTMSVLGTLPPLFCTSVPSLSSPDLTR